MPPGGGKVDAHLRIILSSSLSTSFSLSSSLSSLAPGGGKMDAHLKRFFIIFFIFVSIVITNIVFVSSSSLKSLGEHSSSH